MMMGDYPPGVTGNEPELNDIDEMWIPDDRCGYCVRYNGEACTKEWNNLDDDDYIPERDDKDESDCCDAYEWNGETLEEPKPPVRPKREQYADYATYKRAMYHYQTEWIRWAKACQKYGRYDE